MTLQGQFPNLEKLIKQFKQNHILTEFKTIAQQLVKNIQQDREFDKSNLVHIEKLTNICQTLKKLKLKKILLSHYISMLSLEEYTEYKSLLLNCFAEVIDDSLKEKMT